MPVVYQPRGPHTCKLPRGYVRAPVKNSIWMCQDRECAQLWRYKVTWWGRSSWRKVSREVAEKVAGKALPLTPPPPIPAFPPLGGSGISPARQPTREEPET